MFLKRKYFEKEEQTNQTKIIYVVVVFRSDNYRPVNQVHSIAQIADIREETIGNK